MQDSAFYELVYKVYTELSFETHTLFERSLLQILIILELLIIFYLVTHTLRSIRLLVQEKILIGKTISFESSPKVTKYHFVLFGDSTAFGTGTIDQHNSIAGRLAKDYPHAHIDNRADNGSETKDVAKKVIQAEGDFYDLAIILIGGNDVVFLRSLEKIHRDLTTIITRTKIMTDNKVILISPMNVGSSLLFWFPVNVLYEIRSRRVRKIFHAVSQEQDVPLVDLYAPRDTDFFAKNSDIYFAPDKIHYSAEGYSYIYSKIKEIIIKNKLVLE